MPRHVGDAGAIPSDVKNRVEAAPVRIGGVDRGRAGGIPLTHRCVRGAAGGWPAIARDHLYLHDARVARIDGLVEGSRNRLGSTRDRVIRALLAEDGAVLREVRHVRIPISIIGPPRLYPD